VAVLDAPAYRTPGKHHADGLLPWRARPAQKKRPATFRRPVLSKLRMIQPRNAREHVIVCLAGSLAGILPRPDPAATEKSRFSLNFFQKASRQMSPPGNRIIRDIIPDHLPGNSTASGRMNSLLLPLGPLWGGGAHTTAAKEIPGHKPGDESQRSGARQRWGGPLAPVGAGCRSDAC
jgi:hypothetical protein